MELKDYQIKTLNQVKLYLELVAKEKSGGNAKHASMDAWHNFGLQNYQEKKNGLGEDLPNFCLKIPTGGGKTFLAVKTIDLINTIYLKRRIGLILWIVPSTQIYNQTLKALRDREHVYRQHLDIASGGKTLIKEKTDYFSPQDTAENLVIMLLMLPSANRETKETLRIFKDNGGFQSFFPQEDDIAGQEKVLQRIPNLDTFSDKNGFWGNQVKTSFGNVLRLLQPVIILDEGHKAYSEMAQETLRGFNPSLILELSATPDEGSNVLADISGIELSREEMIKLDLHVINKIAPNWRDTLRAAAHHRDMLEEETKRYGANSGRYIRPICLIQVERTGKKQCDGKFIHAEDAREWLINVQGIPPEQVAVKTSATDELKAVDDGGGLLSPDCPIRYIITKQALQEGWDCSFAYVLTVLTNPQSQNALTQLVGRILRQPYAKKTKVAALDESYVFTYNQRTNEVLEKIKKGFEGEGLGDLRTSIVTSEEQQLQDLEKETKIYAVRAKFQQAAGQTVLPVFIIKDKTEGWRAVDYEQDIACHILWKKADLSYFTSLILSEQPEANVEVAVGLAEDRKKVIEKHDTTTLIESTQEVDLVFLCRHILDIVPNPWVAFEIGEQTIGILRKRYDEEKVKNKFVFIIAELRKVLEKEKDRLAENVFRNFMEDGILKFMVISKDLSYRFPKKIKVKNSAIRLNRTDGGELQRSLFDFVPSDQLNDDERAVAWYLDDQDRLFFWYRNVSRHDYAVQGWRKHKIYPDFIFTALEKGTRNSFDKVFVVETKGVHLKNEDTDYKRSIFDICNEKAKETDLEKLHLKFKNKPIKFEVVFGDEWKAKLNEMVYSKTVCPPKTAPISTQA